MATLNDILGGRLFFPRLWNAGRPVSDRNTWRREELEEVGRHQTGQPALVFIVIIDRGYT